MCDEGRGEKGREKSIFITQQQLVHEGFVSSTDCTSPLHSRKTCTGFFSLAGGSKCFGTMLQKTKHLQKSLGTTLELNMVYTVLKQSRFRWEATIAIPWSPDWPQVCCKNMKWKPTEGSSNSLYCWFLRLLLRTTHTGDFKATPTATPNTLNNHWPVNSFNIHITYGHRQHSNRARYRILKENHGIRVSRPGYHLSSLAHCSLYTAWRLDLGLSAAPFSQCVMQLLLKSPLRPVDRAATAVALLSTSNNRDLCFKPATVSLLRLVTSV